MKNAAFWICIFIWCTITLIRVFFHQPWLDESNAWEIARNLQIGNFFESVKYEGHFFIWYILLMPFAKLDFGYPYSMLMLNWLFCFGAVVILWKYAPFNNFLKTLITFSFPFLACYPVIARCYSVGILLLFILTALYKNRLKYPIIYSLLIVITANTSFVAIFGAIIFGFYLLYDLCKSKDKKNFCICCVIAVICSVWVICQILNFDSSQLPYAKAVGLNLNTMLSTFVLLNPIVNAVLLTVFGIGFLICLNSNKRIFYYIIFVFAGILGVFKMTYSGDFWHYYFLYVYLISGCWIALENNKISDLCKKFLIGLLCFLSFLLIFDFRNEISVFNSNSKSVADYIKEHKNDCSIFINKVFLMSIPYLRDGKTDYDLRFLQNNTGTYDIELNFNSIKNTMDLSKNNYLYINSCAPIPDLESTGGFLKFTLDKNIKNIYCIYKIEFTDKN